MAIIKCKMCGGDIELTQDKTFGTCEFCGCTMTFPKVDDEQRAAAFNRGNHFRRIGEFDKAQQAFDALGDYKYSKNMAKYCWKRADGTVVAVGNNVYGRCNVSDWTNIKIPNN